MRISNFENKHCYCVSTEHDLQLEVVKILRRSGLLFSCSHTVEMLDTDSKRIDATRQGFSPGMPDILVYTAKNGFSGLAIELKHPWGTGSLSSDQRRVIKELDSNNWLVVVSNDLLQIADIILKYTHNLIQNEVDIHEE